MMMMVMMMMMLMMMMQWNLRINGILYQWLLYSDTGYVCPFMFCSNTCCELLLQTVQCKTFCSGVQSNSGYCQEIKAGNGIWRIYTVRYRIGIFFYNYRLSLPTVTPLHVWAAAWVGYVNMINKLFGSGIQ